MKIENSKSTFASTNKRSFRSWITAKLIAMSQPSQDAAEKALANQIARKHEEQMRLYALELSIGKLPDRTNRGPR